MITIEEVIALDKWICKGATEEDREERLERARKHIFPDNLDHEEIEMRESIVARAREQQQQILDGDDPMPGLKPVLAPPVFTKPFAWDGLISPTSPSYRRASRFDGTSEEMDRTREASRGSPFDADPFEVAERQKKATEQERSARELTRAITRRSS